MRSSAVQSHPASRATPSGVRWSWPLRPLPARSWSAKRHSSSPRARWRWSTWALVGRDAQRSRLGEAFTRALRERAPVLATVLGEAGIGKTRLARELAAHLGGEVTVLGGNCL